MRRQIRNQLIRTATLVVILGATAFVFLPKPVPVSPEVPAALVALTPFAMPAGAQGDAVAAAQQVARGAYLVNIGGCNDCHTPWVMDPKLGIPVPDMSRMLIGHPADAPDPGTAQGPNAGVFGPTMTSFRLPMGVVYAANLTPDAETGLGKWTADTFRASIRSGKHAGEGRPVLPPMPWPNLASATDEDLDAMFAFLQTLPPVKNQVPAPTVSDEDLDKLAKAHEELRKRMGGAPVEASQQK